jgi:hypothetical protein
MTNSELIAGIVVMGRREKALAENARQGAKSARAEAAYQAAHIIGSSTVTNEFIRRGEVQAQQLMETAKRHDERAKVAESGYVLFDAPEQQDPRYVKQYNDLIHAAQSAGLTSPLPPYPNIYTAGPMPMTAPKEASK